MIHANCGWCGQHAPSGGFCSSACEGKMARLLSEPHRSFYSYAEAARHFGRDTRTVRRWEGTLFAIDKSLPSPHAKPRSCRVCGGEFLAHQNRAGYCPGCSAAGQGRRSQARQIAVRHQGQGNPNWIDGQSKKTFRHERGGKAWARAILERDGRCRCCGGSDALQAHHVLPAALLRHLALSKENGIALCGFHHTELHRQQLDVLLLPSLYASRSGAQPWHEVLAARPEFQAMSLLLAQPFRKRALLQAVPKTYQRLILRLHPEFARRELGLGA